MAPSLTYQVISRRCGTLPEWQIAAIEKTGGSSADLEIALAWAEGENDVMGEERRPLAGHALRIYEILMADRDEWDDPGSPG